MKNNENEINKIFLVDKPAGVSSFFVVSKIRRILSEKMGINPQTGKRYKIKVGHTGTLDPFATGLLIILTGKMTKKSNEFLKLDKEYIATVRLGKKSSTGDVEGEIFETKTDKIPTLAEISNVAKDFVGEIEQRVPAYSAVKINGERAYKLARAGKAVEMPTRKVKIYEIEILEYSWPMLKIRTEVSSGTYIRQLGEDIGEKLGVGGYLTELRRTKVGEYRIEDAMTIEEISGASGDKGGKVLDERIDS